MALNGIDVASYQGSLDFNNIPADFGIIKATEGTTYVNPYCDTHYQELKQLGRRRGVYHFASYGDPTVEANYFVDNIAGYIGDAILVLDWEGSFVGDVNWALRWLNQVTTRTGTKPLIYMSEYVENNYDWSPVVNANYGLWIAKYSDYEIDNNYDMSQAGQQPNLRHWDFAAMWQWTSSGRVSGYSGNLDCDIFYGTTATWDLYAGTGSSSVATITQAQLDAIFNELLGRNPDPAANDHYIGHYTYEFVKNDVASSPERASYVAAQQAAVQAAIEAAQKAKSEQEAKDAEIAEALKKAQEAAAEKAKQDAEKAAQEAEEASNANNGSKTEDSSFETVMKALKEVLLAIIEFFKNFKNFKIGK